MFYLQFFIFLWQLIQQFFIIVVMRQDDKLFCFFGQGEYFLIFVYIKYVLYLVYLLQIVVYCYVVFCGWKNKIGNNGLVQVVISFCYIFDGVLMNLKNLVVDYGVFQMYVMYVLMNILVQQFFDVFQFIIFIKVFL